MKKIILCTIGVLHLTMWSQSQPALIPYPAGIKHHEGTFLLSNKTSIQGDKTLFETLFLQQSLFEKTGLLVEIHPEFRTHAIQLNLTTPDTTSFPMESYELSIQPQKISIRSFDSSGLFYGIQTLLQLIPNENKQEIGLPCLQISDRPTFGWRGMHLDVARHFFTVNEVKQYLDYLAFYKFNTFHWHLTDDQGWRIEIKKYPKLTQIGGWRSGTMLGHYRDQTFDEVKYGGFYTQDEIREVVQYARERHITVVPEIEMPGHAVAALAAYPEYSCTGGPFEVAKIWGVLDDVFCPNPETFAFLEDILSEVMELFPSEYIHIGGDECPKTRWKACPHCQKLIQEKGLQDEHELQSYFIQTIEKFVNSKGRKIIGWDEILEGGLAPNAAVMSWRGTEGGIAAAQEKHFVVMSPGSHCYFDHYQGEPKNEPIAIGGYTPLYKVYEYQPIPEALSEEESRFILGAQANVWTEYMKTFDHVQYMIFPRIAAMSEVLWGTAQPAHYDAFENRVVAHMRDWDKKGIRFSKAIYEVLSSVEIDTGKLYYTLKARHPEGIRYTVDGSEPRENSLSYIKAIPITKSQTIKTAYFENGQAKSSVITQDFVVSASTGKTIHLEHAPSKNFSRGKPETLIDGIQGDLERFGKNWLGFSGKDMVAVIDFEKPISFQKVALNTFNGISSWIYLPKKVELFSSLDGKTFKKLKDIDEKTIHTNNGVIDAAFSPLKARYLKVVVQHYGTIPDGQTGAGNPAWLFVDEIIVE
jgi:hexosaminidase